LLPSVDLRQFSSMRRKRFFWWLVFPVVAIVIASWLFSLALEAGWLRRSLSARLAASFGRPVEVGRFGFTILGGPKFEALSVTVSEDPRFGQEYFLRAERLTARLRWAALLHGRMEFDSLSLSRPSLNLVRSAEGQWNVETWLPPAGAQSSAQPYIAPSDVPPHASRIDIQAGRINFKKGPEKLPFALEDVSGTLNPQSAGRWLLDLEARPMRAAVVLQASGRLRLRGTVGGTSARLQPADLRFTWESASLADAARLARGTDYGMRGVLEADFTARSARPQGGQAGSSWEIGGGLRLQAVHRWDLAARSDNPAINVKLTAAWSPAESRLEMKHWSVEAPHSNLDGDATIDWSHGFRPELRLLASEIGFPDVVNWSRAFLPGHAEDLDIAGSLGVDAKFVGWPMRVDHLRVSSDGASVRSESGRLTPVRVGPVEAFWSRSSLVLVPVVVRVSGQTSSRAPRARAESASEGVFYIDGALGPIHLGDSVRDWPYKLAISGQTARLQDLRTIVAALGRQFSSSWNIEGPASLQLVCTGALRSGTSLIRGELDLRNLSVTTTALNEPIRVSAATMEFSPGERSVEINGAEALGGHWNGTIHRKTASLEWTFDLSVDRLDFGELGRVLGNRQSLLYRILPFGAPFAGSSGLAAQTEAAIAPIIAQGHLRIEELALGAARLEGLDATADLEHGDLILRRAEAGLYGGRLRGEFRAQLGTELRYSLRGQVDRTDLSALAALTSVKDGFGGIGSGEIDLTASGWGRQALLASLEGEGFLHVQDAAIEFLDVRSESTDGSFQAIAGGRYRSSTVSFRLENSQIRVDPWLLSGRQRQLEIVGDIDFTRRLNLQVRSTSLPERSGAAPDTSGDEVWVLGGTLETPEIVREERVSAGNQTVMHTGRR
jgi:AsmA-like C-terminal region/AsmA family